jgi:hypothetical protein
MFKAAACSAVSGGDRRVLTVPGRGALAITARAHFDASAELRRAGSRIG